MNYPIPGSAVIIGKVFEEHAEPRGHPESRERIKALYRGLRGIVHFIDPRPASESELLLVHDSEYVSLIRMYSELGMVTMLDPDTYVSPGTWKAALHAAGAAVQASILLVHGAYKTVLAAVRPPGHHARSARGAGFCIFNNVAVAAAELLRQGLASRIAIIDIDAHYGDGTSEIFYSSPEVLYVSLHRDPAGFYPGRGFPEEIGEGEGKGYNVAIPLPPGAGLPDYEYAFDRVVEPIVLDYKPDLILVSAGFDAYRFDPIADLGLDVTDYWRISRRIYIISGGKGFAAVLEGGYNTDALPRMAANLLAGHLDAPLYPGRTTKGEVRNGTMRSVGRVRRILSKFWRLS